MPDEFIWRLVLSQDSKWKRFKHNWQRRAAAPPGGNSVKLVFENLLIKMWSSYKEEKVKTYMILSNSSAFIQLYGPNINTGGHLREDYDASMSRFTWREIRWIQAWGDPEIFIQQSGCDRWSNRNNSINLHFSPDDEAGKERERSPTNMSSRLTFVFAVFTFWIVKKRNFFTKKNAQTKTAFINTMRGIRYKQLCNKK